MPRWSPLPPSGRWAILKPQAGNRHSGYSVVRIGQRLYYSESAVLRIPGDAVEGNSVEEHSDYIAENLSDLVEKKCGTLVLFSSRRQMEQVYEQLDSELQKQIIMQGQYSNREMVRLHKGRLIGVAPAY